MTDHPADPPSPSLWSRHRSLFKGIIGGVIGVAAALVLMHLITVYLSVLQIIQFINANAAKIQKLP